MSHFYTAWKRFQGVQKCGTGLKWVKEKRKTCQRGIAEEEFVVKRNLIIKHMLSQSMSICLCEMTEKVDFVDERNLMIAHIIGQNIQSHLWNIPKAITNLVNLIK